MKKISKLFMFVVTLLIALLISGCKPTLNPRINVYTRDTTSGTRDGFFTAIDMKEAVTDNSSLVDDYVELAGNGDIISAIKNDIYGIGYISLSSLEGSTLKGLSYEGIAPNETNVLNGTYLLKRNFNYIIRSTYTTSTKQAIIEAFIAYLSTKEAKATIQSKDGIVSINPDDPSWNDIKVNFPITLEDNHDITMMFGGSTSVEKIAKALSSEFSQKCGNFVTEHNHTGSGDAYKRTQGSEKDGANALDIGFASREFKLLDSEPALLGTTGIICVDAIVVVVHPDNVLNSISQATLKSIYSGIMTTWKELESQQ
jgi:phosphate transport system substrate-binding protein